MARTQIQFPNPLPRRFVEEMAAGKPRFPLRGQVLAGTLASPRRPAVFKKIRTSGAAPAFGDTLRANPPREFGDSETEGAKPLWKRDTRTITGFSSIFETRLATADEEHFEGFGFERVWIPLWYLKIPIAGNHLVPALLVGGT